MIFITAFPEENVRRRVLEAGAIGFLSKPFDDEQLIEHLQAAFGATTAEARNSKNSPASC
jgi:FixJ family two-component response regulator